MVQKFNTLADAVALAEFAHRNQLDKAGLPYIDHPRRVLAKVQAQGALPYVQIAAILHDVTEDTTYTPEMLLALGFSSPAVEVIKLVDRDISEALFREQHPEWKNAHRRNPEFKEARDFFYYTEIRKNPAARLLKLSDIDDNTEPWRVSYLPENDQDRLDTKYKIAKRILHFEENLPWL